MANPLDIGIIATQSPHYRKNIAKFTASQHDKAFDLRRGYELALSEVLTTGDDAYWTTLQNRDDGNGNRSWYVDLHSCDQATFVAMNADYDRQRKE
jgi:hypothetical protein